MLSAAEPRRQVGVIELLNKQEGVFGDEDIRLLRALARPLALSLASVRIFDNTGRLSMTDDLTKLYNYRYLTQYLNSEVKRCLRYRKKVSLLFIDVDGFKRVNDTFGHLVGSRALAEIGQLLRGTVRETDVVGRTEGTICDRAARNTPERRLDHCGADSQESRGL